MEQINYDESFEKKTRTVQISLRQNLLNKLCEKNLLGRKIKDVKFFLTAENTSAYEIEYLAHLFFLHESKVELINMKETDHRLTFECFLDKKAQDRIWRSQKKTMNKGRLLKKTLFIFRYRIFRPLRVLRMLRINGESTL